MLAKPFNRSVAESLLSPTGTNNHWVIDDRGIWPKVEWNPALGTGSRINFEFDSWRPAVMFANDSLPKALGDLPALPFPFDAKDLASFMLYGFGALVGDHYGDWENGPNPERIDDLYPLDFSRRAVKEAFEAYREAQRIVDPYPLELDAKAERARKAWSDVDSETDKETKAERGLVMEATAAEAKVAQGKWLEAMVRQLMQSVPAKATATPAPLVVTSDASAKPAATVDRGWTLKRAALIDKYERRWQTIKRDLQDASENELSKAAKAPGHGNWFEEDALNWARQRGKLNEATGQHAPSPATPFSGLTHRIEG